MNWRWKAAIVVLAVALMALAIAPEKAGASGSCPGRNYSCGNPASNYKCSTGLYRCKKCGNVGCDRENSSFCKGNDHVCTNGGRTRDSNQCAKCGKQDCFEPF